MSIAYVRHGVLDTMVQAVLKRDFDALFCLSLNRVLPSEHSMKTPMRYP